MIPLHQSLAKNYGKQQQHIAYDAYGAVQIGRVYPIS